MYSAIVGWYVLYMSGLYLWSLVLFRAFISLLVFCLAILFLIEHEVLMFPIIVNLPLILSMFASDIWEL